MKIRLAFTHTGPGEKGEIRAYVHGQELEDVLTVGTYRKENGQWTARLWATPGDSKLIAKDGTITAATVAGLRTAAHSRGKWWQ